MVFLSLSITVWSTPLFLIGEKGAVNSMFRDIAEKIQKEQNPEHKNIK